MIIIIVNLIPARRPDFVLINEKKRTCHLTDIAVLADHGMKMKESEKWTNTWILS